MWNRFVRWLRSLFGGFLSSVEDPELILQQTLRDMRDKVPALNQQLAKMKGFVNLTKMELDQLTASESALTNKIKASLANGEEDLARNFVVELKRTKDSIELRKVELEKSTKAYEQAVETKMMYMREMDRKTREAMQAIREARASAYKAEVAKAFETFKIADSDGTYDEMLKKLQQKSAMDAAKLDMSTDSTDYKRLTLEQRADEMVADDLLNQFKVEWGMAPPAQSAPVATDKTIGPATEKTV